MNYWPATLAQRYQLDRPSPNAIRALPRQVKIRQQHKAAPARVTAAGTTARVSLMNHQMSITTGQTVVFFDEDLVLGGG
jgi:tRNA U34 2-thiouridine synthase MnmA/TrmU